MLVSEIITSILRQTGGDTSDTTEQANVLDCMKSALARIPSYIRDRIFLGEGTLSMSAGEYEKSVTGLTGFVRERYLWYVVGSSSRQLIHPPPSVEYFHTIFTSTSRGKPTYYRIYGQTIQFNQPFDEAATVGADYVKDPSSIASSDTFVGASDLIEAVKCHTKAIYYGDYLEDETKSLRNERIGKELIATQQGYFEEQEQGGYVQELSD